MRTELLRFNGAVERDPAIDAWMKEHSGELGAIAQQWFEVMRKCGDEVRELLHDGCPVACLGDAPFGYVNVFHSHVNVGFFHGAALPDPAHLILREPAFQVAFVNCDDVIQEITPATPYPTLCDSILPRTFPRCSRTQFPTFTW